MGYNISLAHTAVVEAPINPHPTDYACYIFPRFVRTGVVFTFLNRWQIMFKTVASEGQRDLRHHRLE
jgi:hypothetical protein